MCMDYTYKPNLKHKIHNVTSGTNVVLCCYKINNTGRMPFLEYLLENVNETLNFHTVPLNLDDTNNREMSTRKISTIASNFLFKVTGVAFENPLLKKVEENGGLRGLCPRSEQNFVPFFQKGDEEQVQKSYADAVNSEAAPPAPVIILPIPKLVRAEVKRWADYSDSEDEEVAF